MTAHQTPSVPSLRTAVVERDQQFIDLRDAWNQLAEARDKPSVFLLHEWFCAAWEWRKLDSSLFLICAYAQERLVGVLPLILHPVDASAVGMRRAELLTVPDTQLCDLLVATDYVDAVPRALAAELLRQRSRWDQLRLDYLANDAIAAHGFREALEAVGFRSELRWKGRNLVIPLDTSWADYYGARSRSLKKANNLAANRLRKKGEVTIEWLRSGINDSAALQAGVEATIEISTRSWKQQTGTTLDHPGPGAFIRKLSELAVRRGWLSVWTLRLNGRLLATEYQLIHDGNVHALRADYDVGCLDISPGSHLNHQLLEQLFDGKLRRYCMGPGSNAYKLRWSSDGEELSQLLVYGRTLLGRYVWLREAIAKKGVKRLLNRLGLVQHPAESPKDDQPDQVKV